MKKPIPQGAGTPLSDVLAFLDTLDSCESGSSSGENIEEILEVDALVTGGCEELNSRMQQRPEQQAEKEHPQDRFVPYSTDLQRRKRAELQSLRSQLKLLQNQLAELKQLRHKRMETISALDSAGHWQKAAMIKCEERWRSERLNRELKAILKSQEQVRSSVGNLLSKRNVLEGIEVVFRDQPNAGQGTIQLDFNASILAELSDTVDDMRLEVDKVLPALSDWSTLVFCSQQTQNESVGICAETSLVTPMACSTKVASDILWSYVTAADKDTKESSFCTIRKKKCTSHEMNCVAVLLDGAQCVDGVSVFRRFDQGDRTILLGATLWTVRGEGFQLEDRSWTIISPSPMNPLGASVTQSYCRMHHRKSGPTTTLTAGTKEAALASFNKRLRNIMHLNQASILRCADTTR